MEKTVVEIGCGSLLRIIYVANEDKADELSELVVTNAAVDELYVTNEAFNELNELVVDDEAVELSKLMVTDSNNQLEWDFFVSGWVSPWFRHNNKLGRSIPESDWGSMCSLRNCSLTIH